MEGGPAGGEAFTATLGNGRNILLPIVISAWHGCVSQGKLNLAFANFIFYVERVRHCFSFSANLHRKKPTQKSDRNSEHEVTERYGMLVT